MKLNAKDIEEFMEMIDSCSGPVYLTDWQVDENGEPNIKLNLKSKISMFIGIEKLLSAYGDWLEFYASNYEDEVKLAKFIMSHQN